MTKINAETAIRKGLAFMDRKSVTADAVETLFKTFALSAEATQTFAWMGYRTMLSHRVNDRNRDAATEAREEESDDGSGIESEHVTSSSRPHQRVLVRDVLDLISIGGYPLAKFTRSQIDRELDIARGKREGWKERVRYYEIAKTYLVREDQEIVEDLSDESREQLAELAAKAWSR